MHTVRLCSKAPSASSRLSLHKAEYKASNKRPPVRSICQKVPGPFLELLPPTASIPRAKRQIKCQRREQDNPPKTSVFDCQGNVVPFTMEHISNEYHPEPHLVLQPHGHGHVRRSLIKENHKHRSLAQVPCAALGIFHEISKASLSALKQGIVQSSETSKTGPPLLYNDPGAFNNGALSLSTSCLRFGLWLWGSKEGCLLQVPSLLVSLFCKLCSLPQ